MSRHEEFDDHEPIFFTELEQAALRGTFLATTTSLGHEIELARLDFPVGLSVFDHGGLGYQEAELTTFSIDSVQQEPSVRRVSREALCRDWIVLPEYCQAYALVLWERANEKPSEPETAKQRRASWFGLHPTALSPYGESCRQADRAREAIQRCVVYSLSSRVESLRREWESSANAQRRAEAW